MSNVEFDIHDVIVAADWIDRNGHLNGVQYLSIFDAASDAFLTRVGFDHGALAQGVATVTAEIHLRYLNEARLGDPLRILTRVVDVDLKRCHLYQEMTHRDSEITVAAAEQMHLSFDLGARRVAPFPEAIMNQLQTIQRRHARLPKPVHPGRTVSMHRSNSRD